MRGLCMGESTVMCMEGPTIARHGRHDVMRRTFTAVVERDMDTGYYICFVPGFPDAHTQAETLDELNANLKEVVEMLLEGGDVNVEAEFVGTQLIEVS